MSRVLVFLALLGFGSCALALSQFVQDIPVTRGLVARWDIEEGTGTTTRDETGNDHGASFVNVTGWEAGPIPSRYWLSLGAGYLYVSDADVFSFTDGSTTNYPFSAEICAKPGNVGSRSLMGKWAGSSQEWIFKFASSQLQMWVAGGSLKEIEDATESAGTLHSYGFSYDGDQTIVLYIDGASIASTTTGTAGVSTNTSTAVNVGSSNNSTSYSITGNLAFAQIYGANLTQEEHAAIAEECRE